MKNMMLILTAAFALAACAADSSNTASTIVQDSLNAGKSAAINTGMNAVTGKLTGSSTSTMTEIAKETAKSGKNAAITKATNSITGNTTTSNTTNTTNSTDTNTTNTGIGSLLDGLFK